MTVGGVDTYYDYEEKQWKSRKLGGGPAVDGNVASGMAWRPSGFGSTAAGLDR